MKKQRLPKMPVTSKDIEHKADKGKKEIGTKIVRNKNENKGGIRVGAGRKKLNGPFQPIRMEFPEALFEALEFAQIPKRQAYFIEIAMKDLRKRGVPAEILNRITFALTPIE